MDGSLSFQTLMKWHGDGVSARTSPKWTMKNFLGGCDTITIKTLSTRQLGSAMCTVLSATWTVYWALHQKSFSRRVMSNHRKIKKKTERIMTVMSFESYYPWKADVPLFWRQAAGHDSSRLILLFWGLVELRQGERTVERKEVWQWHLIQAYFYNLVSVVVIDAPWQVVNEKGCGKQKHILTCMCSWR